MNKQMITIQKRDFSVCFLGRTALALAISESLKLSPPKRIWLPDYLCDTMLYPFTDLGLSHFQYYQILYREADLSFDFMGLTPTKGDLVLWCDYFRFDANVYKKIGDATKQAVLIHDITHSLLDDNLSTEFDNYTVCSVRKWESLYEGGLFASQETHTLKLMNKVGCYADIKKLSRQYRDSFRCSGNNSDYEKYVYYSEEADRLARQDYSNRSISEEQYQSLKAIDWVLVKAKRKKYCVSILKNLSEIFKKDFSSLSGKYLFSLPLFIASEKQQEYLDLLLKNGVKCSIFWEASDMCPINRFQKTNISIEISEYNDQRIKQLKETITRSTHENPSSFRSSF